MRSLIPALIAFPLAASPVAAQQFSAVCSNLSGTRVEDQGSKPRFEPDAVSGAPWAYGWDLKTKKATVTFPTKASGGQPNTQKGTVSFHRGGFSPSSVCCPGRCGRNYPPPCAGRNSLIPLWDGAERA